MSTYKEHLDYTMYKVDASGEERETCFTITVSITPSTPDVPYLSNGDPGYPGDPGEVEILAIHQGKIKLPEKDWEAYGFDDAEIEKVIEKAWEIEVDPGYEERD